MAFVNEARPPAVAGVERCDLIRPDAKVTRLEMRAKKTLITLKSKSTVATRDVCFFAVRPVLLSVRFPQPLALALL
jgi:hypothetical protein